MPTNTLFMTGLLCVWYAISATANPRYRNQWGRSVISSRDLRPLAAIPLDAIFAFRGTLLNVQLDIGMSPRFEESPAAPLGNGGHARIRCHICEAEYLA